MKMDWIKARWQNPQARKPLETRGQRKERKADTAAFVKRIKDGRPATNRYAKGSGPVRVFTPEEVAAFVASRDDLR